MAKRFTEDFVPEYYLVFLKHGPIAGRGECFVAWQQCATTNGAPINDEDEAPQEVDSSDDDESSPQPPSAATSASASSRVSSLCSPDCEEGVPTTNLFPVRTAGESRKKQRMEALQLVPAAEKNAAQVQALYAERTRTIEKLHAEKTELMKKQHHERTISAHLHLIVQHGSPEEKADALRRIVQMSQV